MGTKFTNSWERYKTQHFKGNASLNISSEEQVLNAIRKAYLRHHFTGRQHGMLTAACDFGGGEVVIEQGSHKGGDSGPSGVGENRFCLAALHNGTRFNMELTQAVDGSLEVKAITW